MSHLNIDAHLDWSSNRCGRLLNWQKHPDPFWHYGIGLSDTMIFDTGGLSPFERDDAKLVILSEAESLPPGQVIRRLSHASTISPHGTIICWAGIAST
jgi:hypothetical protein